MKFEIYQDTVGDYRWRLRAANGEIVADSGEGYLTRGNAKRAAETVKSAAGEATVEDVFFDTHDVASGDTSND